MASHPGPSLASLFADRDHLLLDFDGPVCRLFAGLPAPSIAASLLNLLPLALADQVRSTDPHQVLRRVHVRAPELTDSVESSLTEYETLAAASAAPTPSALHLMLAARRDGRTVSIVTNNSATAVEAYLARHRAERHVDAIAGRRPQAIDELKPHPALVLEALDATGGHPSRAILVGNSPSDIEAARRAGAAAVGFVDRPSKWRSLSSADALVTTIQSIVTAIEGPTSRPHPASP